MRASLLLVFLALPFAACASKKGFMLYLRGDPDLNLNSEGRATGVPIKVYRLKGAESQKAFEQAPFDALWGEPITAKGVVVDGPVQTLYVRPDGQVVELTIDKVPPEVTHFGIVGLFNTKPEVGKDRVALDRSQAESKLVWLHSDAIEARDPSTVPKPAPAQGQGASGGQVPDE